MLRIALFVLLGFPLLAYLWETLNRLLAGHLEPLMLLGFVPAALLFWLLLRLMGRAVESWHSVQHPHPPNPPV
jgi:hypothetical protein